MRPCDSNNSSGRGPARWTSRSNACATLVGCPKTSQVYGRYLDAFPDNEEVLTAFIGELDPEQTDQLIQRIRATTDREQAVVSNVFSISEHGFDDALPELREIVGPETAEGLHIHGMILRSQQKSEEAAAAFLEAWKKEDGVYAVRYRQQYLQEMSDQDKLLDAYRQAEDTDEMFDVLVAGYEEEEGWLDKEELEALLELHQQQYPDDRRLLQYRAILLFDEAQHEQAEPAIRKALAEFSADDYQYEALQSYLVATLFFLGKMDEALVVAGDSLAFDQLIYLCRRSRNADALEKLLGSQGLPSEISQAKRTYFEAQLAELKQDYQGAIDKYVRALNSDVEGSEVTYEARSALIDLAVRTGKMEAIRAAP